MNNYNPYSKIRSNEFRQLLEIQDYINTENTFYKGTDQEITIKHIFVKGVKFTDGKLSSIILCTFAEKDNKRSLIKEDQYGVLTHELKNNAKIQYQGKVPIDFTHVINNVYPNSSITDPRTFEVPMLCSEPVIGADIVNIPQIITDETGYKNYLLENMIISSGYMYFKVNQKYKVETILEIVNGRKKYYGICSMYENYRSAAMGIHNLNTITNPCTLFR